MARFQPSLLVLFALVLSGLPLFASEQHDFDTAAAAFQDNMWNRAETEFSDFVKKHPDSAHVPEATLMQAQAEFNQGKLAEAIALLQGRESSAGRMADQYAYWIGQAQFTNGDYSAAAGTFAQLAGDFPGSQWRLDAVVNQAAAYSKLTQWAQVVGLLQKSPIFQGAAQTNATDSRVLNGRLLLAQALLSEKQPAAAVNVLQSAAAFQLKPALDWRRLYLLGHIELAEGNTNEALALTADLMEAANRANSPDLRAQSIAEQAGVLEKMGCLGEAVSVYGQNLTNGAPDDWQRQAVLKIAELSAAQTNFSGAESSLENFRSRFPDSPGSDSALLALGELHLKSYVAAHSITNSDLTSAQFYLNEFIDTYTNSPLLGKAYLDRGWCFWIEKSWADSAADFQTATEKLPPSEDLAVAYFKLGDAAFRNNDFVTARQSYQAVANNFTNYPVVTKTLVPEALYQILRVCLQQKDASGATNIVVQILKIYPLNPVADKSLLIEGESLSRWNEPQTARAIFQELEKDFPNSGQLPDVELAIAQTYEQEANWPKAIAIYDSWIKNFSSDTKLLADVKYAQAWANFQGGRETNAFILFTNFLAEFPSNADLTPVAEWWLGDYYSGRGDWVNAEENYQLVFQYWPNSSLAYPAILMAGRSAMGRQGYEDAKDYFLKLMGETNAPPQLDPQNWYSLDAQAWFYYGDVLMDEPSSDTNNPLANFKQAIPYFEYVCKQYTGSEQAALAWGEIGDCYLQLATQSSQYYSDATNAYQQVMVSPSAEVAARSQAQLGVGMVYEKLAALTNGVSQTALQQTALDNYLDVFFGNNLHDGESADPIWVEHAGLDALPLVEALGTGDPNKFIDQMEILFPEQKATLEKKRLEISRPKS
jgi:TolA-binding protein